MADRTAPFMFDRAAAFRTGAAFVTGLFDTGVVAGCMHMRLNCLGNCIGAGENLVVAEAGRAVAGDAEELFNHLPGLNSASPG